MRYSETKQLIDESIEFPTSHESCVEELGEVELTAPTGESVPVSEVLNRAGEPKYQSGEMLYTTIVGNLDDSFIGRKYFDERGGARTCTDPKCSPRRSL
jgi:hypothetical protein